MSWSLLWCHHWCNKIHLDPLFTIFFWALWHKMSYKRGGIYIEFDSSDCNCYCYCSPGRQGQSRVRFFWLRLLSSTLWPTHLVSCSIWQSTSDRLLFLFFSSLTFSIVNSVVCLKSRNEELITTLIWRRRNSPVVHGHHNGWRESIFEPFERIFANLYYEQNKIEWFPHMELFSVKVKVAGVLCNNKFVCLVF